MTSVNYSQVQSTNDSSTISKCSTANKHYIEDEFVEHFVGKKHNRTSLIHMGYYARGIILHKLLMSFLKFSTEMKIDKIILCGSGFDTTYWKLSQLKLINNNHLLVEIDFPSVIRKKMALIKESEMLRSYVNIPNGDIESNVIQLNRNYFLIGADLNNIGNVEFLLDSIKVNFELPTLFLSECVVTYMPVDNSDDLIRWMRKKFCTCIFINYEQIHPNDGFGAIMLRHFERLRSPLYSVVKYPDCGAQVQRYIRLGFESSAAVSEWDALKFLTSNEENERVITIEQFDEFEEFHLKCCHYVIAVCGTQFFSPWINSLNRTTVAQSVGNRKHLICDKISGGVTLYGHSSCSLENNSILFFGGFNHRQRSSKVFKLDNNLICEQQFVKSEGFSNFKEIDPVHGSVCYFKLGNISYVCLYGGRNSPNKLWNEGNAAVLELHENQVGLKLVTSGSRKPISRYRHSMVELSDLWQLTLKQENGMLCHEWKSVDVEGETIPCGRISHSAVADSRHSVMYVTGGFETKSSTVLNDVWKWSLVDRSWQQINMLSGIVLPRYSHTSHLIGDLLYLVGGVNTMPGFQPGVAVINLTDLSVVEYTIQMSNLEPVLLFNHSSHATKRKDSSEICVYGGGGNCFSFGTFINCGISLLKLKDII